MHTPVCDRLGIEFPIFAFSHCRDVVAAVTNAGGFGVLGATGHSPGTLDIDLTWIDEQTKGKPLRGGSAAAAKYEDTSRAGEPRCEKAPAALPMPLQTMLTAPAQQRINRQAATDGSGAQQLATYFVGQGVGLLDRVRPARQVVEQMVADYQAVAERFAAQLEG
jgi:NAD(P)H-dependent flavin oxidoreductase YrpB (nitropropane dioxygenase family)